MEAAEAEVRAGMLKLGGGMLEKLLAADPGYRGPRVACSQGHGAEFVSYRDKVIDTVLGPVTLTRAWYHCAGCGHGFAPRTPGSAWRARPCHRDCGRRMTRLRPLGRSEGIPAAGGPGRSAPDRQAGRKGR